MDDVIVVGIEFGQNATKAWVVDRQSDGTTKEFRYLQPTMAVPAPPQADEGEPLQRIIFGGKAFLVGDSALHQSPDAIYQTHQQKTEEPRRAAIRLCYMAFLAWAATKAPIDQRPFRVITSHPDSEYEDDKDALREMLTGPVQFATGAPVELASGGQNKLFSFEIQPEQVSVVRESVAPWYAQVMTPTGEFRTDTPLLGKAGAGPVTTLLLGFGFRDANMGVMQNAKRVQSRSWIKGVENVYRALYERLRAKPISYKLTGLADVEQILQDTNHPIFVHKNPEVVWTVIHDVIRERGAALLEEAFMWAGDQEKYHYVLATGGGCQMLQDVVRAYFQAADKAKRLFFADQADGARGLAYLGMYAARQAAQ